MWPVSDDFKRAIRSGARWLVTGEIRERGFLVARDVPIIGGEVRIDSGSAVRRTATVRLAAEDDIWVPENAGDLLFPSGRELYLFGGFRFPWNGNTEMVPLGVFRLARPRVTVSQGVRTLEVSAYDRSRAIARHKFTIPYSIDVNTPYTQAIKDLVLRTYPWMNDFNFDFMESEFETASRLVHDRGENPWERGTAMADAIGAELFFNQEGKPTLQPEPQISYALSEWIYGGTGGEKTITEIGADLDDEQGYNGVIVTGQTFGTNTPPVYGEAWDTDPDSPTYYDPTVPGDSLYGPVPYFITSEFVHTEEQAKAAADGNLRRVVGLINSVDFAGVPNFAHDVSDVVRMEYPEAKVVQVNILDSYGYGLEVGSTATGSLRQRKVLTNDI